LPPSNPTKSHWRAWLPYGDDFRFVDEVSELEPPSRIVTSTDYGLRHKLIGTHRPSGEAVVPGVLLAEQAAQSALLLGHASGWLKADQAALLGRINCTFLSLVPLATIVQAEVTAAVEGPGIAAFRAKLHRGSDLIARIVLAAAIIDPARA